MSAVSAVSVALALLRTDSGWNPGALAIGVAIFFVPLFLWYFTVHAGGKLLEEERDRERSSSAHTP